MTPISPMRRVALSAPREPSHERVNDGLRRRRCTPFVSLRAIDANPTLRPMTRDASFNGASASATAEAMSPSERLLLDIIDTVREPLLILDSEFRVTRTNRAFFQTFRVAPEDTIGEGLFTL